MNIKNSELINNIGDYIFHSFDIFMIFIIFNIILILRFKIGF